MNNLNISKTGNVVGLVSMAFLLLCMSWGFVLASPVLKELHLDIMRIVYPGFSMSLIGAIIGLAESFAYGWLFGAFFAWLCRKLCVCDEGK